MKNHLFVHFLAKTTFCLAEDIGSVHLGAAFDLPKGKLHVYKAQLITTALDEMTKQGLLLLDSSNGTYMLTQPLGTFTQSVQITPYTAHIVADAFNFFARATGSSTYVANKLAITDTEVQSLALVAFSLRDQIDDMHEQIEELEAMAGVDGDGPEGDEGYPPLGAETPENN